jgi:hypothetical protein
MTRNRGLRGKLTAIVIEAHIRIAASNDVIGIRAVDLVAETAG